MRDGGGGIAVIVGSALTGTCLSDVVTGFAEGSADWDAASEEPETSGFRSALASLLADASSTGCSGAVFGMIPQLQARSRSSNPMILKSVKVRRFSSLLPAGGLADTVSFGP